MYIHMYIYRTINTQTHTHVCTYNTHPHACMHSLLLTANVTFVTNR